MTSLNSHDVQMILESLAYTRKAFEEYQDYPSYEFKQERIKEVDGVIEKVRAMRNDVSSIDSN